jgi:hypothetical protein
MDWPISALGNVICHRPGYMNVVALWVLTCLDGFQPEYSDGIGRLIVENPSLRQGAFG